MIFLNIDSNSERRKIEMYLLMMRYGEQVSHHIIVNAIHIFEYSF